MKQFALTVTCAFGLAAGNALAWSNHTYAAYRAFEKMPELAQAAPVTAEPLEAFLKAHNLAGASVLGTGQVVPVLNVPDLMQSAIRPAASPLASVTTAVDGVDAYTALNTGAFDLLVSHVEMPRMDGFDLTAKVRSDQRLAQMPVVLVTALESREHRERGIDVGANAYIVKSSFDQSNLLEVIRRLI